MLHRIAIFATGALLLWTGPAEAQADAYATARTEFIAAWSALAKPPAAPVPSDSEALRTYPLYPYLQAARLKLQLSGALAAQDVPTGGAMLPVDATIESFLAPLGDRPAGRSLRQDWLKSLGDRRAWEKFAAQFAPDRDGADTSLRCQWYAARIAIGRTQDLAPDVKATWLSGKPLPSSCDAAFDWLRARGVLDEDLVAQRARLALNAGEPGLARFLAKSLPADSAAPILLWASLIEAPKSTISALIAAPDRPVEPDALLDGWQRFARSDADAAAALYPSLVDARKLSERTAGRYALAVAIAQSWSRLPRALEFFAKAPAEDFDERAHEWHVRAALWAGDWARVQKAIQAMPDALRAQNRWRYWAARAAEQRGDNTTARDGYAAVVPTDNWYAVLSAARLGQPFEPHPKALPLDEPQIALLGTDPGFVRARELLLCQLDNEAGTEWRVTFDALKPGQRVQAVGLAARWGWHVQAIASAAKQGLFDDYDLLYPRPYDVDVRAAVARTGLPPELIYAIIRQESLYQADAGSSAGALGLMQLMPETARRTAHKFDLPVPTRSDLLIPSVNIPLGSSFLKSLIDRSAGQVPLATASYNAGPAAARRWLPTSPMATDVWVENIPYNETRTYVQRVAWHALVFAWLADRKPRDVSNWLGTIKTPAVDAALAQADE
jgi:soluble lytic murein transglycosylase